MAAVKFSKAVFSAICDRMAEGESVRAICASKDMPNKRTFFRWLTAHPELIEEYEAAVQVRAEGYFDEMIGIADSKADPAKVRNMIDARKWVLARMNPKKYGDMVKTELTGTGSGALVIEMVRFGDLPHE